MPMALTACKMLLGSPERIKAKRHCDDDADDDEGEEEEEEEEEAEMSWARD